MVANINTNTMTITDIYNQLQQLPDADKTTEIKSLIKNLAFEILSTKQTKTEPTTNWDGTLTDFNAIK